jgi:hypothetical protein
MLRLSAAGAYEPLPRWQVCGGLESGFAALYRSEGPVVRGASMKLEPKNGSCGAENGASAQNRFGF